MILGTALFVGIVLVWRPVMVRSGNLPFWQLAARYPDEAYDWLVTKEGWFVAKAHSTASAEELSARDDLLGPFRLAVPKLGETVKFFARESALEPAQQEFMLHYGASPEHKATRISMIALAYPVVAMIAIGRFHAPVTEVLATRMTNLGYLLLGAGLVAGRFGVLGLTYRVQTLIAAVVTWLIGVILTNV